MVILFLCFPLKTSYEDMYYTNMKFTIRAKKLSIGKQCVLKTMSIGANISYYVQQFIVD